MVDVSFFQHLDAFVDFEVRATGSRVNLTLVSRPSYIVEWA